MGGGRPTILCCALVDEICARISDGETTRSICADEAMPAMTTLFRWLREDEDFKQQYARAKEIQLERMAEEILDISDDGTNDYMDRVTRDGEVESVLNHEHVTRSKLRVDSRKWLLSKLAPKKYGDKAIVQHEGGETPIQHEVICPAASELLAKIIGKPVADLDSKSTQEIE